MTQSANHSQTTEPDILAVTHIENGFLLDLSIPPALSWFDGHFPDAPILPGVVQIDWALMLGRRHLDIGTGSAHSLQVKFRKVFGPGNVSLALVKQGRDILRFTYRRGDEILSSGSLKLFEEGLS